MNIKKDLIQTLKIGVITLTLSVGVSYVSAAWTGPTEAPPEGNVDTPINTGTTDQVKDGGLGVNTLSVFGNGYIQNSLGVGITDILAKLHVAGGILAEGNANIGYGVDTDGVALRLGNERTGSGYAYMDLIGDTTYTSYGLRILRGNSGANSGSTITHRGTGNFTLKTAEAADIRFMTNGSERVRISDDGNVGIGTNNPAYELDVDGAVNADGLFGKIFTGQNINSTSMMCLRGKCITSWDGLVVTDTTESSGGEISISNESGTTSSCGDASTATCDSGYTVVGGGYRVVEECTSQTIESTTIQTTAGDGTYESYYTTYYYPETGCNHYTSGTSSDLSPTLKYEMVRVNQNRPISSTQWRAKVKCATVQAYAVCMEN